MRIAEAARKEFETGSISESVLARLYLDYNPNLFIFLKINDFLNTARRIFPAGNCGLATVYLKYRLNQGKIIDGLYGEEDHTFLMIKKNVIDITADQFGGPRVYVGEMKDPWKL